MYKIILALQNPVTGDTETMTYQFVPASLDQAKWSSAFGAVRGKLDELVARSTPLEPPTW